MGASASGELFPSKIFYQFTEASLADAVAVVRRFAELEAGFALDRPALATLLQRPEASADVASAYRAFDGGATGTGLIDALGFLAGMVVLSSGAVADKAQIIFSLYDIDRAGRLSEDELNILLLSSLRALVMMTSQGRLPAETELEPFAHAAMLFAAQAADGGSERRGSSASKMADAGDAAGDGDGKHDGERKGGDDDEHGAHDAGAGDGKEESSREAAAGTRSLSCSDFVSWLLRTLGSGGVDGPGLGTVMDRFGLVELCTRPSFPASCSSQLKALLTEATFQSLKDARTELGVTLHDVIRGGLREPSHGGGVLAGDGQSYKLFSPLLLPIAAASAGCDGVDALLATPLARNPSTDELSRVTLDPDREYFFSSRIHFHRNLAGTRYAPVQSAADRRAVEAAVLAALSDLRGAAAGKYTALHKVTPALKRKLSRAALMPNRGDAFLDAAGCFAGWPDGRGVFTNEGGTLVIAVNDVDHLRATIVDSGPNIRAAFTAATYVMSVLEESLEFDFDSKLGFLSPLPQQIGIAFTATAVLRLPTLSKHEDKLREAASKAQLTVVSCVRETGMVDVSAAARWGVTEQDIVRIVYGGAVAMWAAEQAAARAGRRGL